MMDAKKKTPHLRGIAFFEPLDIPRKAPLLCCAYLRTTNIGN